MPRPPVAGPPPDPLDRTVPEEAAEAAALGAAGRPAADGRLARLAGHEHPRVRAAAIAALARLPGARSAATRAWRAGAGDADPSVRRRAAEVAPALGAATGEGLLELLGDAEPLVAEAAAWALGELAPPERPPGAAARLAELAAGHPDPLVREAAVAALGALGDPATLPAVLAACRDKPAIRRRAAVALAAFDGPEVDGAAAELRADRDWQVRQAAALLDDPAASPPA